MNSTPQRHLFTTEILTSDLTEPYRHLHHSAALLFFEKARIDHLRQIGWDFPQQVAQGKLLVIASIEITYLRELFAEKITIETSLPTFAEKRFSVTQTICNARGKEAVRAVVTQALLDLKTKRAIPLPLALQEALSEVR